MKDSNYLPARTAYEAPLSQRQGTPVQLDLMEINFHLIITTLFFATLAYLLSTHHIIAIAAPRKNNIGKVALNIGDQSFNRPR